jgi:hypothetical protein
MMLENFIGPAEFASGLTPCTELIQTTVKL